MTLLENVMMQFHYLLLFPLSAFLEFLSGSCFGLFSSSLQAAHSPPPPLPLSLELLSHSEQQRHQPHSHFLNTERHKKHIVMSLVITLMPEFGIRRHIIQTWFYFLRANLPLVLCDRINLNHLLQVHLVVHPRTKRQGDRRVSCRHSGVQQGAG